MKRTIIIAFTALLSWSAYAAPRSMQQARQFASQKGELRHCFTARQTNGQPAFYVFNRANNGGFVIISADDRAYTVLGYSDQGSWDESAIPENMRFWLDEYTRAISELDTDTRPHPQAPAASYTPVAPLCNTLWGQEEPYNNSCPTYNGEACKAGCVATAAGQIMKAHAHPAQGTGSNSYKWANENGDSITLSAHFGNTTYNWSSMRNTYDETASHDQQKAVATLICHCGIACEMNYGPENSGANSKRMVRALIENFGYDKGVRTLWEDYMSEESVLQAVSEDLQAGHPVYISAQTVRNEGHAFICDGMDAEGLMHINWGWYGKSNGFFRLSAFNPKEQGTGGSATNRGYTERIQLFTRIQPDAGNPYYYSLACENIRVEKTACARSEKIKFNVDSLHNNGFTPWTGNLAMRVYKDGAFFKRLDISTSMNPLKEDMFRRSVGTSVDFSSYPEGNYEIELGARADDQEGVFIPIMRKWLGEWRCSMTITNESIFIECPAIQEPEHPEIANPLDYTFSLLSAYYYPSDSNDKQHHWKLQLATEGFYAKGADADKDQMLLLFHVFGNSSNSITGDYPSDQQQLYYCKRAYHYYGNAQDAVQTDASEGACTLSFSTSSDTYLFHYRIRIYGIYYEDEAEIELENIRAYYGEDYGSHQKGDRISLVHTEEGIEVLEDEERSSAQKILHNGILYIRRNNTDYTVQGAKTNY